MLDLAIRPMRLQRAALVLRPTEALAAWVSSLGYVDPGTFEALRLAPPVFLLPAEHALLPGPFVEDSWEPMLEAVLSGLGIARRHWPRAPNQALFRRWLAVARLGEVHDLAG